MYLDLLRITINFCVLWFVENVLFVRHLMLTFWDPYRWTFLLQRIFAQKSTYKTQFSSTISLLVRFVSTVILGAIFCRLDFFQFSTCSCHKLKFSKHLLSNLWLFLFGFHHYFSRFVDLQQPQVEIFNFLLHDFAFFSNPFSPFLAHFLLVTWWWWFFLLLSTVVLYPWLRVYVVQIYGNLSSRSCRRNQTDDLGINSPSLW